MSRLTLCFAVSLASLALTSCVSETNKAPTVSERAATGEETYMRDCAWCHGARARGTGIAPAIEHGPASVDFMLRTGRMPIDDVGERIRRSDPHYDDETIEAITDYVAGVVGGPQIPQVHPEQGDTALGAELYLQNCAACHSSTGAGGTLPTAGRIPGQFAPQEGDIPGVLESSATEVAEAMQTGPGNMPLFGRETFDDHEVDSIVAYVLALQDVPDRGGNSLGRIGPVSEGLVAWVVGALAMALVVRWIGTRADQ